MEFTNHSIPTTTYMSTSNTDTPTDDIHKKFHLWSLICMQKTIQVVDT